MAIRKGFYFSFDAFLALLVMSASLAVAFQSTQASYDDFRSNTVDFERSTQIGHDAMKLASTDSMNSFDQEFQEELVQETSIEENDLDRTILDGISLLWASREFDYAEEIAREYFDSKVSDREYELIVEEGEDENSIYSTSNRPDAPRSVSSISRLVSGHSIDQPDEGFQARATATETTANQTKVVDIPMMGSGANNNRFEISRKFDLEAEQIHSATLYFSAQWGQSNFESNEETINGQSITLGGSNEEDWIYYEEKEDAQMGFDIADVTDEVQNGWNEFYLEFNNQGDQHAHIQPGTRLEIEYESEEGAFDEDNVDYLTDLTGTASNQNQRGGIWYNHPVEVPENSSVNEAYLELYAENIEDQTDDDLQVYLNDELLHSESVSGDVNRNIDFSEQLEEGTNILSIYGNVEIAENGEVTDFTSTGNNPRIYSDPENNPEESSRVVLDLDMEQSGLQFGEVDVVTTQEVGGIRENPKEFEQTFEDSFEVANTYLNLAQLDSVNVTYNAGPTGSLERVFQSPREYSTPSRIGTGYDLVEGGSTTDYRLEDQCTDTCDFLPESSIETHITVPSQVGYGPLFESQDEAVENAEERLRDELGEFVDATQIDTESVSTGNQPYIWGPASVKLVVWNE